MGSFINMFIFLSVFIFNFRILSITSGSGQAPIVFTIAFVIEWVGAAIVTLNAQLIGGKVYFF